TAGNSALRKTHGIYDQRGEDLAQRFAAPAAAGNMAQTCASQDGRTRPIYHRRLGGASNATGNARSTMSQARGARRVSYRFSEYDRPAMRTIGGLPSAANTNGDADGGAGTAEAALAKSRASSRRRLHAQRRPPSPAGRSPGVSRRQALVKTMRSSLSV